MSEIQNPSMRPGKPAMLDIAAVQPASESSSDAGFSAVLKEQIDVTVSAKGGKPLPEGGEVTLTSRQLLGGTRVKVSGDEPSARGLEEFARSQGIDPQALGLLKEVESSANSMPDADSRETSVKEGLSSSISETQEVGDLGMEIIMQRGASRDGHSPSLVASALEAHALLAPDHSIGPQLQMQSAAFYDEGDHANVQGADHALADDHSVKGATKLEVTADVLLSGNKLDGLREFDGAAPVHLTLTADSSSDKGDKPASRSINHTASASLLGLNQVTHQSSPFSGAALGLNSLSANDVQGSANSEMRISDADLVKTVGAPRTNSDSSVDQFLRDSANLLRGQNSKIVDQSLTKEMISKAQERLHREHLAGKINLPKADITALKYQNEQAAIVKLPAINLTSVMPDQGPIGLQSTALTPALSVVAAGASFSFESGTNGQQGNHSSASLNLQEDAAEQLLRRQDQQNQLSQRLSQILGQRLSAQIERGSWRVEMDLHPASMGRIEVQLEMRNGELEANFLSSNATTRELLNESLPRLREMLEQFGTNSAYVGLGAGSQDQNDGNSSAGADAGPVDAGESNDQVDSNSDRKPVSDDGLDVMV